MKPEHMEWIAGVGKAYGKCAEVTRRMAYAFPDLRRVRGHYHCPIWGERAHWWLIDTDGSIIDPTVSQFPSGGLGEYVAWAENAPEPTGACINCGAYCYGGDCACSDGCLAALISDIA